jgi:CRISPR-associated endonuclease/helicase Cas3
MTLAMEDFPAAFQAVHGHAPYAWQTRLLHEVLDAGWPDTVAVPTGAGKTAALDIGVFALALELAHGGRRRTPRRIVFAVDRRVIVDQAHERADKLRKALACAETGPLADMAAALRGGTEEAPLHVASLRGGMPREDDWARSPAQPTILCTTVDQLGSRLLFRGYGVSDSMAPIHAGLLGEDALLLLDEAHLSNPFRETLEGVGRRRKLRDVDLGLPWASCLLTATPRPAATSRSGAGRVFRLSDAERAEPAIARRLAAAKQATLVEVRDRAGSDGHATMLADAALRMAQDCPRPAPTVAVIVNRVALARKVLTLLQTEEREAILLTGRVRPVERDDLIRKHAARLTGNSGASSAESAQPLFVVATQCIEAGADFDFDGMVTQLAPLDALRQRFGRLNRQGLRATAPAAIIAAQDEIARGAKDDPLYGDRLKPTWEWLGAHAAPSATRDGSPTLSVGPEDFVRMEAADETAALACASPAPSAPVLRGADLAFLATTNPPPHPDPHLPLFLHGQVDEAAEVAIVWRADLSKADLNDAEPRASKIIACLPPRTGEALSVPVWAAREWLGKARELTDLSDAEAESAPADKPPSDSRPALLWRGVDDTKIVRAGDLRPGDTIVVPADYGGCDEFGWAPDRSKTVDDIADRTAAPYAGRYAALRLHPSLWQAKESEVPWSAVKDSLGEIEEREAGPILKILDTLGTLPSAIGKLAADLDGAKPLACISPYGDERTDGVALVAPRGILRESEDATVAVAATEDDASSASGRGQAVTLLPDHAAAVEQRARTFAACLGLPSPLVETLVFAACHHDDGKADPRFQKWLLGAPPDPDAVPLAKSGHRRGAAGERAARLAAGVPDGWRHEVLSVRLAARRMTESPAPPDPDLALYLIGSHHGQGRPFFRHNDGWDAYDRLVGGVPLPPGVGPERLDFDWQGQDWPCLFTELQRRYGPWGLALLEAVLRLADHRASEAAS